MKYAFGNIITVHTPLSREVFWHKYAKIPRHTSPNSIPNARHTFFIWQNWDVML